MGLFSALNLGSRAIMANQAAIQTHGHNIANANTEGYSRQRAILETSPAHHLDVGLVGSGVEVGQIERVVETFIDSQLRREFSKFGSLDRKALLLQRIESAMNELTDGDLSSAINDFHNAIQEVVTRPEDTAARRGMVESAERLAEKLNFIAQQFNDIRRDANEAVIKTVDEINTLAKKIADLNGKVQLAENSGPTPREANDLRDQRDLALRQLSERVEIRSFEQNDGTVNVSIGGEFLVISRTVQELNTTTSVDRGLTIHTPQFADNLSPVTLRGGELEGLVTARDTLLGSYIDDLNSLAGTYLFEFNKIHSSGMGLTGFDSLTSVESVSGTTADLDAAGLDHTPVNGTFELLVRNKNTGEVETTQIDVDIDGVGSDTTLTSLAAAISAVSNVTASIDTQTRLSISADTANFEFYFANDSSGALAALGLNTFFTGNTALDIAVNPLVDANPSRIAAAQSLAPGDNRNAQALYDLRDTKIFGGSTSNLDEFYQGLVGTIAVETAEARDLRDNEQALLDRLKNEREVVSGVNVDEEMIKLISFQRAFQGVARFLSVVDEMLDTLVNGIL